MRNIKKHCKWIILSSLVTVLGSCYPSADLTVEELDIIGTFYDTDIDFTTLNTFVMPDSIVQIP